MQTSESTAPRRIGAVLPPSYVQSLQVFQAGMGIGLLVFLFVVLFLYLQNSGLISREDDEVLQMLTFVHVLYAVVAYPLALFLYNRLVARGVTAGASAGQIMNALRTASVVRLAIIEGVAFFGLVILVLAIDAGVLQGFPWYWLNLFSTAIMLAFVVYFFPTQERLEALLIQKLHPSVG